MNPKLEARLAELAEKIEGDPLSPEAIACEGRKNEAAAFARAVAEKILSGIPLDGDLSRLVEKCGLLADKRAELSWSDATGAPILDSRALFAVKDLPVPYVIDPIAIRGSLTQLHGPPKGGKSTWALYLSVAGAVGHLPEGPAQVVEPLRVLYVGWEDQAPLVARRVSSYAQGLGLGWIVPEGFHFSYSPTLWINLEKDAGLLERTLLEGKFDFAVLDTFSYCHSVDEDNATEIKPVMANLRNIARKTNSAILYIHHRRKSSDGISSVERARGSTAISAAADVVLSWGDRGGQNLTPVDLESKWGRSALWEVEYLPQDDQSIKWEIRERSKRGWKSAESRKLELVEAMRTLAASHPAGIPGSVIVSVMSSQGLGRSKTYNYLSALTQEGIVTSKIDGKSTSYTLVSSKSEPSNQ